MAKSYANTYLYSQYAEYDKKLFEFVMNAERINTKGSEFEDILYDVKRRKVSDSLAKVLVSDNVVLGIHSGRALPKAFKAFVFSDVKEDKKLRVFIDVTDCVVYKNGVYVCNKLDWLVSYVVDAMTAFVYQLATNRITGNASILKDGGEAFTRCFSYIIDRMYKITTVPQLKRRIDYAIALYYQVNLMEKDLDKSFDSIKANAIRVSDIDPKETQFVDVMLKRDDFTNIDKFVNALGRIFSLKDIKTGNVVSYWMNAFGTGTVFGLEYLPAFCAMMTDAYIGAYLNQQLSIEKVAETAMVKVSKTILQIGDSVV